MFFKPSIIMSGVEKTQIIGSVLLLTHIKTNVICTVQDQTLSTSIFTLESFPCDCLIGRGCGLS